MFTLIFTAVVLFYAVIIFTLATFVGWVLDVGLDIIRIWLETPMWLLKMRIKKVRNLFEKARHNYTE